MTSAIPRPGKLFSKFLLTAVFIVGLSGITATAEDYYDNEQSSGSGMFFYDYADEAGPEAPPAPIDLEPRRSPQLIIVAPPVSEEEYAEPVITRPAPTVKKKKITPPQPARKEAVPVQVPVPTKSKTKPIESVPAQAPVPAKTKATPPSIHKKQPIVSKTLFSEQAMEQAPKKDMEQAQKQKPTADYVPPVIEKLDVEEFVAAIAPGKPTIDAAGNVIHFYSDPMPLVAEPPPDPDYDPDFADFELSRVLPVIDAPDGLYKFSFDGDGIQIAASHTYDNVAIQAGQIVAINMLVTNNSGRKQTFSETVTGPAGVRGIHEVAPFMIEDGQVLTRRIALHLESSLTAGEHSVNYTVSATNASATRGTLSCWFAIRALPRLQFEIASAPLLVENAPFKVTGKLINSGNTGLNVMLNLKGRQKGLQISPARISLPSGGHAIIELAGTTPTRNHPLDDILHMQILAITDKKSGSIQLLDEPIKLRIASKN